MNNKASHFDGYNKGYAFRSGNSSETIQLDEGDVVFVTGNGFSGGAGSNGSFIKAYPNPSVLTPSLVTLPSAPPTGLSAVAYGFVNGNPTWVALTNSTTITAGAVMVSIDNGLNWTAATLPSAPGGAWADILFGNGRFVAVASSATTATSIAYSVDGFNWTYATTTAPGGNWVNLSFGMIAGAYSFVAVAATTSTTAGIATSPDAITWTFQTTTAPAGNWSSVAYGISAPGTGQNFTSTAAGFAVGTTTIPLITGTGTILQGDYIQFAGDTHKYLVTTGISGPGSVVIASPGLQKAIPAVATAVTIARGAGAFIATALGTSTTASIAKATVLTTWTYATITAPLTTGLTAVTYNPIVGAWVALASSVAITAGVAYYSYNGTTWFNTTLPAAPSAAWVRVTSCMGTFLAIAGGTSTNRSLMTSTDGINWTFQTTPTPGGAWKCIAGGDKHSGTVIAVANVANASTSMMISAVGPSLMIEHSGGDQPEGQPDVFICSNKSGFSPDVTQYM